MTLKNCCKTFFSQVFYSFYAFTMKALEAKSRVSISSLYKIMDMLCFQIIINHMKDMSK
ncbi:hypothetical protein PRUPE_6G098000 [Prunus persica]|uniref:Uncharacterized protein n=1 Tax=Prunus persica TaxID=3760 RepID=A0A251NMS0_PRUPE|nr:hypothetical protein PRUPE_6G098000 [Prunus persica]